MNINCIKIIIGAPIIFEDYSNYELILIDGSDLEIKDLPIFCKKFTLLKNAVGIYEKEFYSWNIYSDSRFNGLANYEELKKEFPNLKLFNKFNIKTISLNDIVNPLLAANQEQIFIDLEINNGNPLKILESAKETIYNIKSISINSIYNKEKYLDKIKNLLEENNFYTKKTYLWIKNISEAKDKRIIYLKEKLSKLINEKDKLNAHNIQLEDDKKIMDKKFLSLNNENVNFLNLVSNKESHIKKLEETLNYIFPFKHYAKTNSISDNSDLNRKIVLEKFINSNHQNENINISGDFLFDKLSQSQEKFISLAKEKDSLSQKFKESQQKFEESQQKFEDALLKLFPKDEYLDLREDIKALNFSDLKIINHFLQFGINENPEFNFKDIISDKIKTLKNDNSMQKYEINELKNLISSSDKEVEIIKELFAKLVSTNKIN